MGLCETLSPLGVQMGVRTAKITKIASKITKKIQNFGRNLCRVLIPALTTQFKTKNWAACRLVFLCLVEQFLQAEYQRVANGVYPFERVGGSASHIYIEIYKYTNVEM